ncbi:MAG: AAA family ATPase [Bacilli bacterium]|nr:AAA family ATPase [Methanobrevibacter sp.]MBQ6687262.1 AAA family ATPase [Bacilli bacterium]
MPRKGLGKGLDSLIPDFYDEDFDSNSTQSLEDMLNDIEEKPPVEEKSSEEKKNIFEELEEENDKKDDAPSSSDEENEEEKTDEIPREVIEEDDETSEGISGDKGDEDSVQTSQKAQVNPTHVEEVKEIVDKNPRITLWSARSSAVFRYLRKTEPEFSISKEASTLIDEAVSKKYPEIWELFDDY